MEYISYVLWARNPSLVELSNQGLLSLSNYLSGKKPGKLIFPFLHSVGRPCSGHPEPCWCRPSVGEPKVLKIK
jgi:hypothetical protein